MGSVGRSVRGVVTVARRRGGLRYGRYLVTGVGWPRFAYRYMWGPQAQPWLQAAFSWFHPRSDTAAVATALSRAGLLANASVTPDPPIAVGELSSLVDRAHAAGVACLHAGFSAVARSTSGSLAFVSVPPGARLYHRRGAHFHAARDADRRALNAQFEAGVLTEADARRLLRALKASLPHGYRDYAPIDFGGGLSVGQIASTDSGTGRWEFFNRDIVAPLVEGKRVLDLGANNGSLPLMMLRAGAAEVVAIEFNPALAEFARLNARILAWRDIRPYSIQVLTGDMRLFLEGALGQFDVVTAFCSLYYLPAGDMARIVERAAAMGATLILQANDAIHNLPATTAELQRLMLENGYSDVRVYAPAGFARPLLVGAPSAARSRVPRAAALASAGAERS